MAATTGTNHIEVLEAVVCKLIDDVECLTKKTCFITASALNGPPPNVRENLFVTVSPGVGNFLSNLHTGGGSEVTVEDSSVEIELYSTIKLDRISYDSSMLINQSRGLLSLKKEVLKCLSGYIPTDGAGTNSLVSSAIEPLQASEASSGHASKVHVAQMSLSFATQFLWDLS